ncbi:MAG: hypothetical protein A3H35_02865 [Betaproteobacteria bacterium RIFCSPLOWO2_02_FULL_62_17]|nr:MAG: hypothetical protein A3H35_02865 [Betaproteobacteria bacterium RIFCSPLOWO2_02_FULL_62_17]
MSLYWLLGFPGWRIAANLGIPIRIKVDVYNDTEANVYYAVNKDIGLAVESESLDGLVKEIHAAMPELLLLIHSPAQKPEADIRLRGNFAMA